VPHEILNAFWSVATLPRKQRKGEMEPKHLQVVPKGCASRGGGILSSYTNRLRHRQHSAFALRDHKIMAPPITVPLSEQFITRPDVVV